MAFYPLLLISYYLSVDFADLIMASINPGNLSLRSAKRSDIKWYLPSILVFVMPASRRILK